MSERSDTNEISGLIERSIHRAADAHLIVSVTDENGLITHANTNFLKLCGYTLADLHGKSHGVLNAGFHSPEFFENMWQRIKAGKSWQGNLCNQTITGQKFWVNTVIAPMTNDLGLLVGFTSVATDITRFVGHENGRDVEAEETACLKGLCDISIEDVGLEEVLEKALERLVSVSWLKLADKGGLFLKDNTVDTLHLAVSHNLADTEKFCSKRAFGYFEGPDLDGHYCLPLKYDNRLLGVLVVYVAPGTVVAQEQEDFLLTYCNTLGLLIQLRQKQQKLNAEMSRSNRLSQQAQLANCAANQAAEAKANFLATMSHEIRTPMNSVLGVLFLMEQTNLTAEQMEYAAICKDAAEALMQIIDDILDYGKYEQGAFVLEESRLEIRPFFTTILEPFEEPALAKGIGLYLHVDDDLPTCLVGDQIRLRQLISNLLSNALKFTEQGRIMVKIDRTGTKDVPQILIIVADSGRGIPAGEVEHVFERFSQADSSITRKYGGTGIGLAICKTLAIAMKGEIGVDTVPGEGSTFWVRLPLRVGRPDFVAKHDTLPPSSEGSMRPLNILVAEDNASNLFLIRKILEVNNHAVTCARDGREAVEIAAKTTFDVILMDVQMPVMDGLCATREIRKLPAPFRDVPIYAVSANALSKHHQQSKEAGMNGHIDKPIRPAEIYRVLDQISYDKQGLDERLKTKFG